MARKNPHIGSSFESWLEDAGIREEATAGAIKAVIARQLASEMKKKKITKQRMAELMKTSRAQVDRLLDPDNGSATIESLQRAAKIVGRELRLQLVQCKLATGARFDVSSTSAHRAGKNARRLPCIDERVAANLVCFPPVIPAAAGPK
jgi:predicted transcriptional regulator